MDTRMKLFVVTLCLCLLALFAHVHSAPIPVVIDTDIGDDMDDTWALGEALKADAAGLLDIKMVLTAAHNTVARAQIVAKFLESVGRSDINVGIGIKQDDHIGPQYSWAQNYSLDSYPGPGKIFKDGVSALVEYITGADGQEEPPLTLIGLAPFGNMQELIARVSPDLLAKINMFAMAGSIHTCYQNQSGQCPEYNVKNNIPASQAFFAAKWNGPMTITPLDTCGAVQLSGSDFQAVLKANASQQDHLVVKTIMENYEAWLSGGGRGPGVDCSADLTTCSDTLFDPVAVSMVLGRSNTVFKKLKLKVNDAGVTEESRHGEEVDVAIDFTGGFDAGRKKWEDWYATYICN